MLGGMGWLCQFFGRKNLGCKSWRGRVQWHELIVPKFCFGIFGDFGFFVKFLGYV